MRRIALLISLLLAGPVASQPIGDDAARQALVRQIERSAAELGPMTGFPVIDRRVLDAFAKVPRHHFVPPPLAVHAYRDTPLPLGHGQNLTQPFLLALMTQALELKPGERVFETGTDTGYQAAILAELGVEVFSMEIVDPLLDIARKLLPALGYTGIRLQAGDGYYGWAENGPYDAMVIKESAVDIPGELWRQLRPGGRMVIPLGPPGDGQMLTLVTKQPDGRSRRVPLMPVRFAPFQGGSRI
jgi:protein-L-isoaspartate(D-aspartate) O-methyltransferase